MKVRPTEFLWASIFCALLAAYAANGPVTLQEEHALYEVEAVCDTDTDCMRFCPPPADDPDCDGGPQS